MQAEVAVRQRAAEAAQLMRSSTPGADSVNDQDSSADAAGVPEDIEQPQAKTLNSGTDVQFLFLLCSSFSKSCALCQLRFCVDCAAGRREERRRGWMKYMKQARKVAKVVGQVSRLPCLHAIILVQAINIPNLTWN